MIAAQRALVQGLLDGVARIGADPPGITREAFGRGENEALALVAAAARPRAGGCTDAGANLTMRWAGTDPEAPPLLVGSHLDSVVQGGNFDGAAGVIAGLAAVAALQSTGFRPRAGIEVMALRCEEAVWFGLGLIGSRSLLGRLPEGALACRMPAAAGAWANASPTAAAIRRGWRAGCRCATRRGSAPISKCISSRRRS